MKPGDLVECIDARNSAWYLELGGRYVVQALYHTDDGRVMVGFVGGPAILWPWEQFRVVEATAEAERPEA